MEQKAPISRNSADISVRDQDPCCNELDERGGGVPVWDKHSFRSV